MSECTFLIGNGINRAVCNESFKLEKGMEKAWSNVSEDIRTIISDTLNEIPKTEEQLEEIQAQIFTIISIQNDLESLHTLIRKKLHLSLVEIQKNYFSYLFDIAECFYDLSHSDLDKATFKKFSGNFSDFIKNNNRTHVATLNYDCMLYNEFLSNKILDSNPNYLVDGFWGERGFQGDHLEQKFERKLGWYLHLHGSPLYYTDSDHIIKKSQRNDNLQKNIKERNHIIVCSPKQKPDLIKHSYLLREYFNFFKRAVSQSKNIILIGYGGKDEHINNVIRECADTQANILIIERTDGESEEYWKKILPQSKIKHLDDSILDFDFSLENFS